MRANRKKASNPQKNSDYAETFDYTIFCERLDKLLKERNMTQVALAEAIEVDKQTIYRWKKGNRKTPIDYKTITKLAKFFYVDKEYLYDPQYKSPHQFQEELEQHMDEVYTRNKPFIDFLESIGIDVDMLPPNVFVVSEEETGMYSQLNAEQMDTLIKKTALFIQMQLL